MTACEDLYRFVPIRGEAGDSGTFEQAVGCDKPRTTLENNTCSEDLQTRRARASVPQRFRHGSGSHNGGMTIGSGRASLGRPLLHDHGPDLGGGSGRRSSEHD